jgi:hypothetical protein
MYFMGRREGEVGGLKKDKTGWSACGEPVWTFGFQGPGKRWQAVNPNIVRREAEGL